MNKIFIVQVQHIPFIYLILGVRGDEPKKRLNLSLKLLRKSETLVVTFMVPTYPKDMTTWTDIKAPLE